MRAFDGLHVVVTGGTGALGSSVVRALVDQGCTVHVPCHMESEASEHPLVTLDGVHLTGPVDLSNEDAVAEFYGALPSLWASIQCAGAFLMAPLTETSARDFGRMHTINTVTCFLSCREATRQIRATGDGGRLVNVGAMPAVQPVGGMAAVVNLTQSLAAELAGEGILSQRDHSVGDGHARQSSGDARRRPRELAVGSRRRGSDRRPGFAQEPSHPWFSSVRAGLELTRIYR